ncbi:MAG TPA: SIS domain-containing protein [Planctomycetota bacterium]|nr:SIS domain-containing protein [Planctomycetota bacterium]
MASDLKRKRPRKPAAAPLARDERVAAYVRAVRLALDSVPDATHAAFVDAVLAAGQIVVAGRGRSGMMGRAFARRLGQMGLRVWGLDDTTVPRLGAGDLLIACTGSGETPTVLSLLSTARSGGARVLVVTRAPARAEITADVVVELPVPAAGGKLFPLGTLFEASLLAYLDQVVVDLVAALGATESDLGARHTNLE